MKIVWAKLLEVLGRVIQTVLVPALIGLGAWVLELLTDAVSWAVYQIGSLLARGLGTALQAVDLPAPNVDWTVFGQAFLRLVDLWQMDLALAAVVGASIVRLLVYVVTLGRF